MKNSQNIWPRFEYLHFLVHFSSSSSSYIPSLSRTTDPYFNNAKNKIPKNQKGVAIKKDPRRWKIAKRDRDSNILAAFLIFLLLIFLLCGGPRRAWSHPGRLPGEIPKWLKARHGTTTVCVSQRVIFATIKPANALLDGKCAR